MTDEEFAQVVIELGNIGLVDDEELSAAVEGWLDAAPDKAAGARDNLADLLGIKLDSSNGATRGTGNAEGSASVNDRQEHEKPEERSEESTSGLRALIDSLRQRTKG